MLNAQEAHLKFQLFSVGSRSSFHHGLDYNSISLTNLELLLVS